MSMILTMTAAAVIAGMSLAEISIATLVSCEDSSELSEGLETIFTDAAILQKTFTEMDCHMKVISDNEIHVSTTCGNLVFKRENAKEAFTLYLDQITDADALVENIRSFEVDYGRNVQDYTYHHIKDNLASGMHIEEEYVDGEDLYITITVD